MNACDYRAVAFDGAVYCTGCLPEGISEKNECVHPVFASSEWDYYPTCDHCHEVHDYVILTAHGVRQLWKSQLPKDLRDLADANDDTLPGFAWPGGYPMYYLDKDNGKLCAKCASRPDIDQGQLPIAYGVHYEGESIWCEDCNAEIPSAYGNPEKGA